MNYEDCIQVIPPKGKVLIDTAMNQIEAKLGSYWLKVNKIKHVSASYTGKIQMLCEINMLSRR